MFFKKGNKMRKFLIGLATVLVSVGWVVVLLNRGSLLLGGVGLVGFFGGLMLFCVLPEKKKNLPRSKVEEILAELEAGEVTWRPVGKESYMATRPDDQENFLRNHVLPEGTEPQVSGPPARYIGIYKVP